MIKNIFSPNHLLYLVLTLFDYLFAVLAFLFIIPASVIGNFKQTNLITGKRLSAQELEAIIASWAASHVDKIESIIKNQEAKDGSIVITIKPKSIKANTITFYVGPGIDLFIKINNYSIGFDNDDEDYNQLNEEILSRILSAYLKGDYYIKEWHIGKRLIDGHLYLISEKGNLITSYYDATKTLRRFFSKIKITNFQPL